MEEIGFIASMLIAFAFGTFWFYLACAVTFVGVLFFTENEMSGVFPTVLLVGFVVLMQSSGAFNLFAEPWILVKYTIYYFLLGTAWSLAKWISFLYARVDEFKSLRTNFIADYDITDAGTGQLVEKVPADRQLDFNKYLAARSFLRSRRVGWETEPTLTQVKPDIADYKENIIDWIVWWPTSLCWTIISDPMVRIANWIFRTLQRVYQKASDRVFSGLE